jgi:hypothetical protein
MGRRRRGLSISIGTRYRSRQAGSSVWEVYGFLDLEVGQRHVMLFKVLNPTERKTLSEFTLEQSGMFYRLSEESRAK